MVQTDPMSARTVKYIFIDLRARLGVYYFFVVDSVCLSVPNIDSSFFCFSMESFLDGIEPFLAVSSR